MFSLYPVKYEKICSAGNETTRSSKLTSTDSCSAFSCTHQPSALAKVSTPKKVPLRHLAICMLKILVSQNEAVQTHGDWENHPYPCHSSCFNHVWDKYAPPESPFSDCPVVCDSLGEIEPTSLGRHRLVTP